jgi:holo-[acyl-carrier protein] synthase
LTGRAAPGIGIDLIEIDRLDRALRRYPRLAGRLFREEELRFAAARRRPARHLAARFAAKEAAIKALGGGIAPREIEVIGATPPRLRLHGRAGEAAAGLPGPLSVSLTHSREHAAAVVATAPGGG